MALEFFNYDRNRSGQYLVSSDFAVFTVDQARALVQSASIQYQQRVEMRPELGSHEIYWLTGQASGAAQMQRLVGQGGLLNRITPGGAGTLNKGRIAALQMEVSSTNTASPGTTQDGLEFANVLAMEGAVLRGISWGASAAGLELSESLDIAFASLRAES